MNFDGVNTAWWFAIGGIALLIAEVIAPGFFLIFIGLGAIATGVFALLLQLGVEAQLLMFTLYTGLAVLGGRRFYARPRGAGAVHLNDRPSQLTGRRVSVTQAIDAEGGRVRLGDGEWSARGDPAAIGETVIIRRVEGNCLIVEQGEPNQGNEA